VVAGRLAPGTPLIEAGLSKRLAASRTPIRAALRRLLQEGFVSDSPVGQTLRPVVTPLTASDLAEVFLMAGALEGIAAQAAAALDPARRAALVSELEDVITEMGAAGRLRPPDLGALWTLDARFHRAIAEAGAGPRLREELDVLYSQAARYGRAYGLAGLYPLEDALDDRRSIVQALGAGDGDLAWQRVTTHWRRSLERYQPIAAMLGEQGTW
jgi:DNA-binding GntR family transcriptional regulator